MLQLPIFVFFLFVPIALTWAQDSTFQNKRFFLNVGTHTEFYKEVQNDGAGTLRIFDPTLTLGLGIESKLNSTFLFLPEANWVLPKDIGNGIIRNHFMLRADLGYDLLEWIRLRAGTSLMWLNQQGTGGSEQINNGNSTSTFYYPGDNRSSINNTLDFGAEILTSFFSFRLQTYTYSPFNTDKRQISYTVFVSYYWDGGQ